MAHGSQCDCGMCKIGKKMGMIKDEKSTDGKKCACNSGKNRKECCKVKK